VHARGSKGLTPLSAARGGPMSSLVQSWAAGINGGHP
jgi:hypothetical protein